jgi:putative Holliday junction resolvase
LRIIGIDYGEKRIGVAASDPTGMISSGLGVIKSSGNSKADISELRRLIRELGDVGEIVVGLPKTMRGEIGPQAKRVLGFVEELRKFLQLPVKTWDERLTTVAVEKVLIQADVSRGKRKKVIDKSAAVYMLQGYLDSRNRGDQC